MSAVAVVTSTRADWGLLKPFCDALTELGVSVRVVATGTHLSPEHGSTIWELEKDGYIPDVAIPIMEKGDSRLAKAQTMANALSRFSDYFARSELDAVLLLGDRYEILAVAEAAFMMRIPIVHLHGGEVTYGAIDDCVRHCITKLSAVHLVCAEDYANRVRQLGESPENVFNIGAIGVENALSLPLMDEKELADSLGLGELGRYYLFTYHPVTLSDAEAAEEANLVLETLLETGVRVIATKANADAGGGAINGLLENLSQENSNLLVYDSLGAVRYLSALKHAIAVVGNSSSGILEAPAFNVPTVNIGPRQAGRIRAQSVIDCDLSGDAIAKALAKASDQDFISSIKSQRCPFGSGDVSRPAAKIIRRYLEEGFPVVKVFRDMGGQCL